MISHRNLIAAWICFLGGFFVLYQFLLQGSTSLMVHTLMQDLYLNLIQIGFLSSAFFYPYILLQIPAGFIIDKFGPKKTLFVSTFILAVSTLGFSFSECFGSANISRIIMGIASAPGVACAMYLAARWYPQRFTLLAGLIEMMGMLGGALGDYFLEIWIQSYGWRIAMIICAIIGFILALLILIFVKSTQHEICKNTTKSQKTNCEPHILKHFIILLKNLNVWRYNLFGGLIFTIISAFASLWCIGFLQTLYPDHVNYAAYATAFVFIGAAVGAALSGWLASKIGCQLVMQLFSIIAFISFSLLLYLPMQFSIANIVLFLLGCGSGAYILPFGSVEKIVHPDAQGMAMGFTNMIIIGLGGPLLQPLIGWILSWYQSAYQYTTNTLSGFQTALLPITIGLIIAVILAFIPQQNSKLTKRNI
ncbi:MFS transporter [Fastidiosibacter lacustris]|uniref:MFS transporter n=1 Tax=Fastidiosibacter lacustris TaxID=2056695 RepID=UPI000E3479A6|nr:MFS transporter [Fastidiosibacter lacustris]